jgi:uncharacterized protein (DUF362 family)
MNNQVFVVETDPVYPEFPYPEESGLAGALRVLFGLWQTDPDNPFKQWLSPGKTVVIKPNWVLHQNPLGYNLDSLITHSSFIKYLIDRLSIALKGTGRIVIGDAPIQGCNFDQLRKLSRINDVVQAARVRYPNLEIIIEDWRLTLFETSAGFLDWGDHGLQKSIDDFGNRSSENHCVINLGKESFLEEIAEYSDRFRVSMYNPSLMAAHHCPGIHEYLVTKRIFEADLIINLAKMKTHCKAGLTGGLKNLVGINGHKEYLPHHIKGSYFGGGDNYCLSNRFREYYEDFEDVFWERHSQMSPLRRNAHSLLLKVLWKVSRLSSLEGISSGGWSGNETIWRMILDLNHILYFSDRSPTRVITIVDGVVAGEAEGPLRPTPKPAGVILAGENPAYIDAVQGKLMGYNIARIPTVYHAIYNRKSKFGGERVESLRVTARLLDGSTNVVPFYSLPNLNFVKPRYWKRADYTAQSI